MKRGVKYWIMRAAALEAALQNDAADVAEYSISAYNRAIEKINADIRRVYDNLGKVTGLNDDELRQIVSAAEHDELYRDLIKQYKETLDPEKKKELADRINAQAYGARISRLEMIKSRAYVEMIKAANLAHAAQKRFYEDVFQETYYTEIYNRVKGANIGIDFSVLPKRAIELALNEPWHGYNYSERIWKHNERFIATVRDTIVDGLISGQSHKRIAQSLEEFVTDTARGGVIEATRTLVRSETSHFMNQGQLRSYNEMGTSKYRFCAALSEGTCDECADLDGNEYYISEAVEGKNYPPIHPRCRCITIGADYGTPKERIARDPETGKTYKVAGNMTYREWEQSLTEEQRAAMQTHVRQLRNKSADKKTFEKYREIFGKDFPQTLDGFQELRYNKVEEWKQFKAQKQSRLNQMDFKDMSGLVGKLGNREVRLWYKYHDEKIAEILDSTQSLEEQAKMACELRNEYRTHARDLMKDQELRKQLDIQHPNMPFEFYYKKYKRNRVTGEIYSDDEVFKKIIEKSATTNKEADRKAGVSE